MRAKLLREHDPNFDVYVGPVGVWMPWEPDAYKTGRVEFLESQLNELMSKKKENEDTAKDYFNQRIKENKKKAIEENMEKAGKHGNKLTQTLDNNGDLIGVKNIVDVADVRKMLFENDNVVTKNNDISNLKQD
jgi:hypothetical protein